MRKGPTLGRIFAAVALVALAALPIISWAGEIHVLGFQMVTNQTGSWSPFDAKSEVFRFVYAGAIVCAALGTLWAGRLLAVVGFLCLVATLGVFARDIWIHVTHLEVGAYLAAAAFVAMAMAARRRSAPPA